MQLVVGETANLGAVFEANFAATDSGVADSGAEGRPPLAYILIFSIFLVFSRSLFFAFFEVFSRF